MNTVDQFDRIENLLDTLDMVRTSDIARRCGVQRWTVSRWKNRLRSDGSRWIHIGWMPPAHLVVAGVEFWSSPLLEADYPEVFPKGPR